MLDGGMVCYFDYLEYDPQRQALRRTGHDARESRSGRLELIMGIRSAPD